VYKVVSVQATCVLRRLRVQAAFTGRGVYRPRVQSEWRFVQATLYRPRFVQAACYKAECTKPNLLRPRFVQAVVYRPSVQVVCKKPVCKKPRVLRPRVQG
jgi:hypothetical protein